MPLPLPDAPNPFAVDSIYASPPRRPNGQLPPSLNWKTSAVCAGLKVIGLRSLWPCLYLCVSPCPMTRSAPAVRKRDPAFLSRLLRPILRATTKGNNSGARPRRWFTFLVYQQPWTSGHSSRYKNCTSAEDGERTIAVNGGRTTAEEMEGAAEARVRVRPSRRCCTSELSRGRTGARDPYGTVRPHHRE